MRFLYVIISIIARNLFLKQILRIKKGLETCEFLVFFSTRRRNMENLYKREICINCANKKCKNRIKVTRTQDLVVEQISTITTIKCDDFICKKKRKKALSAWQEW